MHLDLFALTPQYVLLMLVIMNTNLLFCISDLLIPKASVTLTNHLMKFEESGLKGTLVII